MKIYNLDCRSGKEKNKLPCGFLWGCKKKKLQYLVIGQGRFGWIFAHFFFVPQRLHIVISLMELCLTVTIIWVPVGATTRTVHIASWFPASSITITVTAKSNCHLTTKEDLTSGFYFLYQSRLIPVSSWHWAVVIAGSGIRIFSIGIISGRWPIVPRISGVIPTGVAVKDYNTPQYCFLSIHLC